jgi:peptidoglycan/xylan/chitin deacetylase (PgdA/CDA1 family)
MMKLWDRKFMCPKIVVAVNQKSPRLINVSKDFLSLLFALLSKICLRKETVILMYHSIQTSKDPHAVDPLNFQRQIEYLRKNYDIVSLKEIVDYAAKRKKIHKRSVAITFDDGSQDIYETVFPYFSKNNLPATVFVTTGFIDKEWPWGDNSTKILTWQQIKEISDNAFEIGAHTVTHPNLQKIDYNLAEKEIKDSKIELEKHINKKVRFFSYPFGSKTPETVGIVMSSNYEGAVGGSGTVRSPANLYNLNRIQVDKSVSFILFKARLTNAVDVLNKIEQLAKKL